MDELKSLIEDMWEELHDCEKYTKKAFKCKEYNKAKADMYMQNAREEYTHFERLHDQAIKCLNHMRDEHGNVPKDIHTIWEWESDKLLDKAAHAKNAIALMR